MNLQIGIVLGVILLLIWNILPIWLLIVGISVSSVNLILGIVDLAKGEG